MQRYKGKNCQPRMRTQNLIMCNVMKIISIVRIPRNRIKSL